MKILAFTNITLVFPFHELWKILKDLSQSLSRLSYLFTNIKIWQRELIFRAVKCLISGSFWGLHPLELLGGSQHPQTPSCKFFTTKLQPIPQSDLRAGSMPVNCLGVKRQYLQARAMTYAT